MSWERNLSCKCGSGIKTKKCCGTSDNRPYLIDFSRDFLGAGNLPVRVLKNNVMSFLEDVLKTEIELIETEFSLGLNRTILIDTEKKPITIPAEISPEGQITFYEPFCQYLWSLTYALIAVYDQCYKKPLLTGQSFKELEKNTYWVKSFSSFDYGYSLFKEYSGLSDTSIPNPEKYWSNDKTYIEKTNAVYSGAMAFTLLHEIGHHFYGHHQTTESKKSFEFDADDFAAEKISPILNDGKLGASYKYGAVIALLSLIFLDGSLSGGSEHPDPHHRLKKLLYKLNLDDRRDEWGIASLGFLIWGVKFDKDFRLTGYYECAKDMFDHICEVAGSLVEHEN